MKFAKILVATACVAMTSAFAVAGNNPKCPVCKMELTSKKDKAHAKAVKIGKKTYFCCAGCPMDKKKKG